MTTIAKSFTPAWMNLRLLSMADIRLLRRMTNDQIADQVKLIKTMKWLEGEGKSQRISMKKITTKRNLAKLKLGFIKVLNNE